MSRPKFKRAVIVGLGLLGGSLALALRKRRLAERIVAIGRRPEDLKLARKAGLIDEWSTEMGAARDADLIVLCGPFRLFESQLKVLSKVAPLGCLCTEVGSVKGAAVSRWHWAAEPMDFVASHPMAGGEKTGWRQARADLFQGASLFLTPLKVTRREAVLRVGRLWEALGAEVSLTTPEDHDRLVARVSHLPHAVAYALCAALASEGRLTDFYFAGKGFWDSTRVAASDPGLWADIFKANRKPVARGLRKAAREMQALAKAVEKSGPAALQKRLAKAAEFRRGADSLRSKP
jgi:prephenate dehydrogenase